MKRPAVIAFLVAFALGTWGVAVLVATFAGRPSAASVASVGTSTTPVPFQPRTLELVATVGTCTRCARPLTDGALVIYAKDGREAFRGCGTCLVELLDAHGERR